MPFNNENLKKLDENRISEFAALLPDEPIYFGTPYTNRTSWDNLPENIRTKIINTAEVMLNEPDVIMTEELAKRYTTIGDRQLCDAAHSKATLRVRTFALAECIENSGRFINAYENAVKAKCNFPTWVGTAHDRNMENFYGHNVTIDLCSACFSWELAISKLILGDKISSETIELIDTNLNWRTLKPFEQLVKGEKEPKEADWWFVSTNNWNAVCLSAVLGTAMAVVSDNTKRGLYLAAWEAYIEYFYEGFTDDGYCSEGLAYWGYGFSNYLYGMEIARRATKGIIDGFSSEKVRKIAICPRRMALPGASNTYPYIADCRVGYEPEVRPLIYSYNRMGLSVPSLPEDIQTLYADMLLWFGGYEDATVYECPNVDDKYDYRSWFEDAGILICRSSDNTNIGASIKGGNNREHHNHNDVGSFVFSKQGVQLISDVGHEIYTADTFSDKRYLSYFYSSYGHSVPLAAGFMQKPEMDRLERDKQFAAKITETYFGEDEDRFAMDLTDVYDRKEILNINRTFIYLRQPKVKLTIEDNVEFDSAQDYEIAFTTYGLCEIGDNTVIINNENQQVQIKFESDTSLEISEELMEGNILYHGDRYLGKTPRRIAVKVSNPVRKCRIVSVIE